MSIVVYLLVGIIVVGLYAWFIEPGLLQVSHVSIKTKGLLESPIRILFISDLHIGRYNRLALLKSKLARLKAIHDRQPFNCILLGGDLIDWEARFLPDLLDIVSSLASLGLPIYAVPGNHDYFAFSDIEVLKRALAERGCNLLLNEAVEVLTGAGPFSLVGIDDLETNPIYRKSQREYAPMHEYAERASRIPTYASFDSALPDLPRILLSHNPDAVFMSGRQPDLVLAGHTHGGQTIFHRFLGGLVPRLMPQSSFIGWAGHRSLEGTELIVSRGIQGSLFPLRFLCPPQAHVITLVPTEKNG